MSGTQRESDYLAYQLRLWRTHSGERAIWRVSLKSARTRESKGFTSLDDLVDFLRQQTGEHKKELAQRRVNPTRRRVNPTRRRVNPTRRRVNPTRRRVNPTRRRQGRQ